MSPDWVDMLRNSRLSRSDSAYFVSDSGWICSEFRSDFNRPTPTGWVCSEIRSQGTHIYPEYLILSLFLGAYLPECPKLVLAGFSRNVGGYGPNYAPVKEDKHISRQQLPMQLIGDQAAQPVEGLQHIDVALVNVIPGVGMKTQHGSDGIRDFR